jgi:hypothetical protein
MPIIDVTTEGNEEFYKNWYYPATEWKIPGPKLLKLPEYYSFDLEKMKEQILEIKNNYGFEPFPIKKDGTKKRRTYKGIGLTSRPDAENPLYDSLHLYGKDGELDISDSFDVQALDTEDKTVVPLYEKHFSEPTEIFKGYIAEVLGKFKSPLTKTRILELSPRGIITPHVDFPYYEQIRVHAVIATNDDVYWEVEGEKFRIPADGNFYWFDTGRYHAVWNDGKTDRIVLSVNLSIYSDRDGNPINRDISIDDILISDRL